VAFVLPAVLVPAAALGAAPLGLTLACVGLALAVWGLCAARFRLPWAVVAGYPVSVALGSLIALRSLWLTRAGRARWKGRLLPVGR
jgi:hypothetical protein